MIGVLAAIMSSLDSQFSCLGTMFTNDIILPWKGKDYFSDGEIVKIARYFVVGVVIVAYLLSLALMKTASVFNLGMWCFSGFTALFPIVFAALYWKTGHRSGRLCLHCGDRGALGFVVSGIRLWGEQGLHSAWHAAHGTVDDRLRAGPDHRFAGQPGARGTAD